jgi:protein SCO1/2
MNRTILLLVLGLVIGAAAGLVMLPEARRALLTQSEPLTTTGKALIGGPFNLVDQTGKRVTDADFRGKSMLVFFGFTSCPDICPAGLQVMTAALDKLGPKSDNVTPVFITVDAERDTPEKLAEYVKSFSPRLVGLTGTPEEVAAVAKAYRVYAKKVPDPNTPGTYTYDHSSILYLMGPDGNYVAHFSPSTDVDKLARQLSRYL